MHSAAYREHLPLAYPRHFTCGSSELGLSSTPRQETLQVLSQDNTCVPARELGFRKERPRMFPRPVH
jgi:hypothetical protein